MVKRIIFLSVILLLSGCSIFQKPPPEIIYKQLKLTCTAERPSSIELLDVSLNTVQDKEGTWWVAIDGDSYENLAINNAEILKYIKDTQAYSEALEDCIEKSGDTKKQ